ncbi:MAG: hypothetical protein IJW63_00150 [Lachnospiraceae bacterium]|nr:hypothetical protein [Lachnospiraceae bacterium]
MASWMVHLRVAEKVFERMSELCVRSASEGKLALLETEYVMGNIAPDSGVPSEDWTTFTPSTWVSHFSALDENGLKKVDIDRFTREYLANEKMAGYDERQLSFYLGYYNHLLTDMLWAEHVVNPSRLRDKENFEMNRAGTLWKWKKDWYDLDFLYLQKHPDFHAFHVYENAIGFKNEFIDFFAEDAFDNRRQYITGFYLAGREGLDREYPWLNEEQMDAFVDDATQKIVECNVQKLRL